MRHNVASCDVAARYASNHSPMNNPATKSTGSQLPQCSDAMDAGKEGLAVALAPPPRRVIASAS
jgi:hypothetical protein